MPRAPAARSAGRSAEPGPEHRIVLLTGKELFLHAEHTERLREKLRAAHGGADTFRFDGESADPAAVLDECRTFGLMSPHKLVVVDAAEQFVKDDRRPIMERYAAAPSDGATLVLRAETWRTGKLDRLIEACGVIVACDPLKPAQAVAWCVDVCRARHGATLSAEGARLLVDRLGTDLARLDGELEKLALDASGGERAAVISERAVAETVGRSREEAVWVIQSALLTRDAGTAVSAVRDAVEMSRHPTVLISWACVDLARKLHGAARGLDAGERPFDLVKSLRLWGDSQEAILSAARRMRPDEAATLLRAAVEADVRQKTGGGDPQRLLERLALRFASV
jgi:DNA polymerase III delta subunit